MQRNLHCFFRSEGRLIAGTIRFFDLFSGIGGFREGLQRAGGFTCVGHCEADAYADHNYRVLFDTEGEWFCNDARNIETERMPDFDLLCAGFPCVIAEPLSFRIKQHPVVVVCICICFTVSDTGEAPCPVQPFSESSDSTEQVKKSNCSGYQPPFAAKKTVQISLHRFRLLVSVL